MNPILYEHHFNTSQTPLSPFKLKFIKQSKTVACNWHKQIEIILVTEGTGTIRYGAKEEIPLCSGEIAIVNSEVIHQIYSDTGISYYYIIIDEKFCSDNGIDVEKIRFIEKTNDKETVSLFLEMKTEIEKMEECATLPAIAKVRRCVLSLMIDLCDHHLSAVNSKKIQESSPETYTKKAMIYLNEHYTSPFCLETLSNHLGINKHYLSRIFKKYTGQTPLGYSNMLRCRYAEYSISKGISITEAAFNSGFESLSYFSRTYKKLRGMSPTEFKNNLYEEELS
ncbi:MAG: AraC family transcriptional regulator [Ruminococcaceae bacterium]|nr:AraC family transcriptional regulator [Oscillospiraceae bacterium]